MIPVTHICMYVIMYVYGHHIQQSIDQPGKVANPTRGRQRSLPRVRRHRASTPQGSSERVLPWQVTMDQLIFVSLSHIHYR